MKLPNGYGSVYKLSGKRRRPWGVRKTAGWTVEGKQIFDNIGYYETRKAALQALADYNANPYDLNANKITFSEMYVKWSEEKFSKISKSNVNGYRSAYKICETIHDIKFTDLRKVHMQNVVDKCDKGYDTLRKIKVLFNQLFKYGLENDIVTKNYSNFVDIGRNTKISKKKPFSPKEIDVLWENVGRMDYLDTVLIMIYTGLRPGELITIESKNVDLDKRTMVGGLKTDAGKDRVIPINKKILPFVKNRLSHGGEFLISNHKLEQIKYYNYLKEKWDKIMEQLEFNHKPHECRHTFASLMDSAGANKLCIKRIMGHASQDITDKVYTHKDIDELIEAVDLI